MKKTKSNDGKSKAGKPKALGHEARILKMSDEHQKAYKEIRDLLDGQRHDKARAWYAVGRRIVKIKGNSQHGREAVAKIARFLGRDASTLYEAGRVASRWTPQAFKKLLDRRDEVRGNRLSWSHFVELEPVSCSERRGLLIEKTLGAGLSVRELKKAIDNPKPDEAPENSQPTNVAKALRSYKAANEAIVENTARHKELIFGVLRVQEDEELGTPIVLKLLRDAHAKQLQAKAICEEQLAEFDAYIARSEKLQTTAKGNPKGRPQNIDKPEDGNNG